MTAREIKALRREQARLLAQLLARGGRDIDLAEEIDDLGRDIARGERARNRWHKARGIACREVTA